MRRETYIARSFTETLPQTVSLEMVIIPSGEFMMGSPETEDERSGDEGPQHRVAVQSFLMGKYPITQEQWRVVAALRLVKRHIEADPSHFKGKDRPVEQASWLDAEEFCLRVSEATGRTYRLPSEAEWEYACRAGTQTPFAFGETITSDLANFNGNYTYASAPEGKYRQQTTDVGSFLPNAFGLYDMHGNVWEWCLDHWHDQYNGAPTDGSAWLTKNENSSRILRGGSWFPYPRWCRSAYRGFNSPDIRYDIMGFRVVCDSPGI
ncbi:MAG: formylglycine-generating enzyme family protein [Thermosynechococcaceae cyanobacterium MS004]|nr:formylglycine-generating enzyme family protein [Thermosynechococcaceae cyanobacterium MS004]